MIYQLLRGHNWVFFPIGYYSTCILLPQFKLHNLEKQNKTKQNKTKQKNKKTKTKLKKNKKQKNKNKNKNKKTKQKQTKTVKKTCDLKLFSIRVKILIWAYSFAKNRQWDLLFLKAFSWDTYLWVTLSDFKVENPAKFGREICNFLSINKLLCAVDKHN